MSANVIIYTKNYCPYCTKAKELFKIKGVDFTEIDITNNQDYAVEMVKKSDGRKTVPQIFINDKHIGGCDDLYALNEKNELDILLK